MDTKAFMSEHVQFLKGLWDFAMLFPYLGLLL